ncbi:hypothetical protein ACE6H2_019612 [Prunus campanulata]
MNFLLYEKIELCCHELWKVYMYVLVKDKYYCYVRHYLLIKISGLAPSPPY